MNNSARAVSTLGKGLKSRVNGMTMSRRQLSDIPIGPRQFQQVKNWMPTAMTFGACSAVGGLYFTDWRLICEWIPFYSGKYKDDE